MADSKTLSPEMRQLAEALEILNGAITLPPRRRARAAALLARSALEARIDQWLLDGGRPMPAASTRVKLVCLRVLVEEDKGREAAWLYARLSHACHQHAYELAPNAVEIVELVHGVQQLDG